MTPEEERSRRDAWFKSMIAAIESHGGRVAWVFGLEDGPETSEPAEPNYRAGQLAYATVRRAIYIAPTLVRRTENGRWQTFDWINGGTFHADDEVTDVRPLVALDVNTASHAATALEGSHDNGDRYCAKQIRDALNGERRV